ncbi:MAG: Crp/Fnr family transcriptional regulator [Clostridia bacterium]|nr:Crp/Fnr family transcriptional regulator [Clostridia bacterium]
MKNFIPILKDTRLFSGVEQAEIEKMLGCLRAEKRSYKKGEYVFCRGDIQNHVCVLLEGELIVQNDDYWGNRTVTGMVMPGDLFGEISATPGANEVINDIVAVKESSVAFFDVVRMLSVCSSACGHHTAVVQNLFFSVSEKNISLEKKLDHVSRRTTREKLLSYLSEEAKRSGSPKFQIPFNRQQLADYLFVDRSALSNELCKMRDDGLLRFEKNRFELLMN